MEATTLTVLVVTASILSSVVVDVTVNTIQDWYDTFYQDAFWSNQQISPELAAQLAKEEADINRLIRESDLMNGAAPRL